MQELEKVLEEIDAHAIEFEIFGTSDDYISVGWVKDIIRKYISHENDSETARSSRDNDGWVPVDERLPEDEEMMLVTCQTKAGRRSVNRAWYGAGCWHGTGSMSGVTAWMPLPEPYSPERSSNEEE